MIVTRLILAFPLLALLAACGDDAPADDGRGASGEVLEGTISDAMLPVDRVRSEPPLEDPEAFAEARSEAAGAAGGDEAAADNENAEGEQPAAENDGDAAPEPEPEVANE